MLFNSIQFAFFFLVVVIGHRLVPNTGRRAWLLAASLLFYVLWYPAYLVLLLVDIALNFVLLRAITHAVRPRLFLGLSVTISLSILAYYKYAAFIVTSLFPFLGEMGLSAGALDIVLPLGISFYTFQIIALAIDTYRGQIEPPKSISEYALFVTFFPQLIAGPILRGGEFLPQLRCGGNVTYDLTRVGIWLFACGLLKKVVFGDYLLAPFVNEVFGNPGLATAPVHLIAAYSFAFQIYFDFSGYTDMARGLAAILGFNIPLNFREPYLSTNPSEFWRRWHQTLSSWLRDYLYIPLGGNRGSLSGTYRNLFLTMLLGGLWHGASWQFVVWGGLHGVLLGVHRAVATSSSRPGAAGVGFRDAVSIAAMFHATCFLWIFFRAESFNDAALFIGRLVSGSYSTGWPLLATAVVCLCWVGHVAERWLRPRARRFIADRRLGLAWGVAEGLALGAILGLALAASGTGAEFIYFQF
jgi:D-alanyl-lipoteichoic acid acyltransferase DltB (MBOAT superfamily)